jgi:hypothetical protein
MKTLKVTIEIETERNKEMIIPYIKYSCKMLKIKDIKIEEKK